MADERDSRFELAVAGLVAIAALAFHACFFYFAGPLWRDEANSMLLARLPDWGCVWGSLHYDSFPALYPCLLRGWTALPFVSGDLGSRLFGSLVGLTVFASIWLVSRMLGSRFPLITLLLLAANPLLITEGDSIRPYGIGLVCLIWVIGFLGRCILDPSPRWLCLAALFSVLAVQATYTNALFVGVLTVSAAGAAVLQSKWRTAGCILLPGSIAAISLLPYARVLRRAGEWIALVHYRVDWDLFFGGILNTFSAVFPAMWLGFAAWAVICGVKTMRHRCGCACPGPTMAIYTVAAAVLGVVVQIVFTEVMKVPPFPRYFLSCLVLIAFAMELQLARATPRARALCVLLALLLTIPPSVSWLRLRRTNVDQVAAVLSRDAKPADLIVISPWFLHTSFQRYYRGKCEWITIPPMEQQPIMRYDLVKQAMMRADAGRTVSQALQAALARGSRIWLVSQAIAKDSLVTEVPVAPPPSRHPDGQDYVSYRSFWERETVFRLSQMCTREGRLLPDVGPLWEEEHLVLACWRVKSPPGLVR